MNNLSRLLLFGVISFTIGCSARSAASAIDAPVVAQGDTSNAAVQADGDVIDCSPTSGEAAAIETAYLYVEYNAPDEDLGVHGNFDGEAWTELCVYAPNGDLILAVRPQSALQDLAMAGFFFESREPTIDQFSFADLTATFAEGQYQLRALSHEGKPLSGAATFTHDVPLPAELLAPAMVADEEEVADAVVPIAGLVIEWADVTETVNGDPLTITSYELIVTKVEHDDPNGFSRPIFDVHLPPDRNRLSVPPEFLEPNTVYEVELLALETSGNQTIAIGFFTTE